MRIRVIRGEKKLGKKNTRLISGVLSFKERTITSFLTYHLWHLFLISINVHSVVKVIPETGMWVLGSY